MTWKDKLEIGLKPDAPYRKDNLPKQQVRGPEVHAGEGRSPLVPAAAKDKNVVPAPTPRPRLPTEEGKPEEEITMPTTLHDAFLDELRDTYDAELQVVKALPVMAKAATSPKLKAAFEAHLKETHGQVSRLENAFASLDENVRGKHCDGMAGILREGQAVMEEDLDETTMDACLIASAQRVEHYEMAAYGTLVAWARSMSHTEVADLLEETLNEEKSADSRLSSLARDGINKKASAQRVSMASAPRQGR